MNEDSDCRYWKLIQHSTDLISIVDEDGIIQYHSPSIDRVLGYEPQEVEGENAFEYFHPDDRNRVLETFQETVNAPGERTERVEYRFQHKNGSWFWLESIATNQTETDLDGYVITSRPIEERKSYEQALEQRNEQLKTINRVVRHDIRNDMSVIIGWAELLEDHVSPGGRNHLTKIQDSGNHVVELTKTVRDFVETLGSAEDPEVKPTPLRSILFTELDVVRATYPEAEFTVVGELQDIEVEANELLGSVFRNLLHNAVQHNQKNNAIVEVDHSVKGDTVIVQVADNGPGIPDGQKESIFGKAEKGLDSPGTGIGLYLVQVLVTQYDGRVWVEDNEPHGSIFKVQLPLANQ